MVHAFRCCDGLRSLELIAAYDLKPKRRENLRLTFLEILRKGRDARNRCSSVFCEKILVFLNATFRVLVKNRNDKN